MITIKDIDTGEILTIDTENMSYDEIEAAILGHLVDPSKYEVEEAINFAGALCGYNRFDDERVQNFLGLLVLPGSKGTFFSKPLDHPRYVDSVGTDTMITIKDIHAGETLTIDKDEMSYDEVEAAILGHLVDPSKDEVEEAINFAEAIWGGNDFDYDLVRNFLGLTVQH